MKSAGANQFVNWDGRDFSGNLVPAGIYIYQFQSEQFSASGKMALIK